MKNRTLALLAALALAVPLTGEPKFVRLSADENVASHSFVRHTKTVTIVSKGTDTCYFRLFTDIDTEADATTTDDGYSAPLDSGEGLTFAIYPECSGANAATCRDSESYVTPGGRRASYYKSISYVCGAGDSATLRVYAK